MMATACGPEGLVEPLAPVDFEQGGSAHLPVATLAPAVEKSPRAAPPPNPPFVFPARPEPSSAPSSYSRASGRRPRSAIESGDRQFGFVEDDNDAASTSLSPALPAFSFNPGASLSPDSSMLSPPLSPQSPRVIPARPNGHGHRRGGSEYVGGSIRGGDAIAVMSTSPTKTESGLASPTMPPPRHAGRRGHAHRRSAALSSHDLSSIMNANNSSVPPLPNGPKNGTHPETREPDEQTYNHDSPNEKSAQESHEESCSPEKESETSATPDAKPAPRARVGFSDNIEYIPRPLSLVSSDTSSTITARPGHSVSGSISSIVSGPASAPIESGSHPPLSASPSRKIPESRPSTAGAILERTQSTEASGQTPSSPRRRNSIPLLLALGSPSSSSLSSPSPTKTPKRWSFFGLEPFIGVSSPRGNRPSSSSSSDSDSRPGSSPNSSAEHIPEVLSDDPNGNARVACKKSSKKQGKVKGWAGSLLTRRTKGKQKGRPPVLHADLEITAACSSDESQNLPEPAQEEPSSSAMPVVMVTGSPEPAFQNRSQPTTEDDGSCAVIDLDAALGPFNTPLPYNPEWEAAQRAGAPAKRKLHSAAGMSHFNGPGGHYHRRAESAPEMAPFEHGRFGFHRFGSSSTMADVFEEEEEEEDSSTAKKSAAAVTTGVKTANAPSEGAGSPDLPAQAESSEQGASRHDSLASESQLVGRPTLSDGSLTPAASVAEDGAVQPPRAPDAAILEITSLPPCDPGETAEASPRRVVDLRELAPVDVSLQLPSASLAPGSPFSMTHSSSFPSPRSPMSYDANRVSTAPSSIAEENTFQSLLLGEPGPEVRYSIDADIPSLTSSNSTMTKDSSFPHQPRCSHGSLPGQRPASFSAAASSRRRSSLVSLSRLISSSHGEKSKLSMEVTCDSEPEKKQKHSKTKRLSRRLQFWKPSKEVGGSK